MKFFSVLWKVIVILLLIAMGVYIWYWSLDENHQRFVKNIFKQIPSLPGRYSL